MFTTGTGSCLQLIPCIRLLSLSSTADQLLTLGHSVKAVQSQVHSAVLSVPSPAAWWNSPLPLLTLSQHSWHGPTLLLVSTPNWHNFLGSIFFLFYSILFHKITDN